MAWANLHGFGIFHHAEYKDGKVIGFQKWGRGYSKYVFDMGHGESEGGAR